MDNALGFGRSSTFGPSIVANLSGDQAIPDHRQGRWPSEGCSYPPHRTRLWRQGSRMRPHSPRPGAPGRTRTFNRRLRRPMLCPVELRALDGGTRKGVHRQQHATGPLLGSLAAFPAFNGSGTPLQSMRLVGVERFELPTSCSQSRCATRLRHTPLPSRSGIILTVPCRGQSAAAKHMPSPSWLTVIVFPGTKRPSSSAFDSGFSNEF